MRTPHAVLSIGCLLLLFGCGGSENTVEIVEVEGIPHVMNPAEPLKGTIALELEKIREIDPFAIEDAALDFFRFTRDAEGHVILFDPGNSEGHRYGPDDQYLGTLSRLGQGPGEFPLYSGFSPFFIRDQIWIVGVKKLAKFDRSGRFIEERRLRRFPEFCIEENRFITGDQIGGRPEWIQKISVVEFPPDSEEVIEYELFRAENTGIVWGEGNQAFAEIWGTPRMVYVCDRELERVYVALNTEYDVFVKDLKGETLNVIHRPYEKVNLTSADKLKLLTNDKEVEPTDWRLKFYPDTAITIRGMKLLPGGYLAVLRVSGVKELEVDVFDTEGRFQYVLMPPAGFNIGLAEFYDFGLATITELPDGMQVYEEYRVLNLPELFGAEGH